MVLQDLVVDMTRRRMVCASYALSFELSFLCQHLFTFDTKLILKLIVDMFSVRLPRSPHCLPALFNKGTEAVLTGYCDR
jgi:hypothetical protein